MEETRPKASMRPVVFRRPRSCNAPGRACQLPPHGAAAERGGTQGSEDHRRLPASIPGLLPVQRGGLARSGRTQRWLSSPSSVEHSTEHPLMPATDRVLHHRATRAGAGLSLQLGHNPGEPVPRLPDLLRHRRPEMPSYSAPARHPGLRGGRRHPAPPSSTSPGTEQTSPHIRKGLAPEPQGFPPHLPHEAPH